MAFFFENKIIPLQHSPLPNTAFYTLRAFTFLLCHALPRMGLLTFPLFLAPFALLMHAFTLHTHWL